MNFICTYLYSFAYSIKRNDAWYYIHGVTYTKVDVEKTVV